MAAAFTLALAAGLQGPRAMRLANTAAGVVVMEPGTAICPLSRLRSELPGAPQPRFLADELSTEESAPLMAASSAPTAAGGVPPGSAEPRA